MDISNPRKSRFSICKKFVFVFQEKYQLRNTSIGTELYHSLQEQKRFQEQNIFSVRHQICCLLY